MSVEGIAVAWVCTIRQLLQEREATALWDNKKRPGHTTDSDVLTILRRDVRFKGIVHFEGFTNMGDHPVVEEFPPLPWCRPT